MTPDRCLAPRHAGFTLIELMVVCAVMSILAMAVLPLAEMAQARMREKQLRQALFEIRGAIDAYKAMNEEAASDVPMAGSGYPPNLRTLTDGVSDPRPARRGQTVYFLRRLPRDPFAPEAVPALATWGVRSYDSPPDNPKQGADVYDVFSLSKRVGTNGIPVAQW